MKLKWMPSMFIEVLYRNLHKEKQFAKETGEVIPYSVLIRSRYNNIEDAGLFNHTCYNWRIFTSKTWEILSTEGTT